MFTIIYHQDLIKKSYLTQKCQLWWYGTAVQLWEPTLACIDLAGTLETVTTDGFICEFNLCNFHGPTKDSLNAADSYSLVFFSSPTSQSEYSYLLLDKWTVWGCPGVRHGFLEESLINRPHSLLLCCSINFLWIVWHILRKWSSLVPEFRKRPDKFAIS